MNQFPKRPEATEAMILAAAEVVAAKIDADAATIAQYYQHPMDGYDLAKELDKHAYWDTSREDMEALDEVESLVSDALKKEVRAWAETLDQTMILPAGVRVRCPARGETGVITGLAGSHSPACYLVCPDSDPDTTMRWVLPYEDAELVPCE